MKEPTGREKREHDRVRISSSKNLWNLSEGGAYVATQSPRTVGALLHFELKLDDSRNVFRAVAKVVRVLYKPNPKIGEPAGMALQFVKVSEEDKKKLTDYLRKAKENPMREKIGS